MKRLTPREQEIMRAVWNNGTDIAEVDLKKYMYTKKETEYARTTLATFLKKIEQKGYITKYRQGRNSYVHAVITVEEYLHEELKIMLNQYCVGDTQGFQKLVQDVLDEQ